METLSRVSIQNKSIAVFLCSQHHAGDIAANTQSRRAEEHIYYLSHRKCQMCIQ